VRLYVAKFIFICQSRVFSVLDKLSSIKYRTCYLFFHSLFFRLVDLKNGAGAIKECDASEKADCMIAMKDSDFLLLMAGKLQAQQAFMKGQLKIKGNMMLAQKLDVLVKAKPAL
jgi:hypothetical protein